MPTPGYGGERYYTPRVRDSFRRSLRPSPGAKFARKDARLPDRDGAQALPWNTVRRFLLGDRDLSCGEHSGA
jgi:hypothetical protein